MFMTFVSPLPDSFPDVLDLRSGASVVDGRADLDDHPPQHVRVDLLLQHDGLGGLPLEDGLKQVALSVGKRHRHRNLDTLDPLELLEQPAKLQCDRGEDVHPPLVDQKEQEIPRRGREPGGGDGGLEGRLLVPAVDLGRFHHLAQKGCFGNELVELLDFRKDPAYLALFLADGEQRAGVSSCQAPPDQRTISRILSMFSRTIRSWSPRVIVFATISSAARAESSAASLRSSARAFFTSWSAVPCTCARSRSISACADLRRRRVSSSASASIFRFISAGTASGVGGFATFNHCELLNLERKRSFVMFCERK